MTEEADDIEIYVTANEQPIDESDAGFDASSVRDDDRRSRYRGAALAAVLALMAGGIVVVVAVTRQSQTKPAPAPAFEVAFSARGMLAEIPSGGSLAGLNGTVSGTDFAAISEMTGVERVSEAGASGPTDELLNTVFVQPRFAITDSQLLTASIRQPDEFEAELRFSFLDMDRLISATGDLATSNTGQFVLSFDSFVLGGDMSALRSEAGDDRIIDLGDGSDGEVEAGGSTVVRISGQPLRVGVDAERPLVAMSKSTPYVDSWLDPDHPTLLDDPDFAAAAEALDSDDGLYSAQLERFDRDLDLLDSDVRAQYADIEFPIVEEFTTIGIGWSGVGDDQQTTIVYVFADEAAATASIDPVRQLFASVPVESSGDDDATVVISFNFTLDDVTTMGRTVVVRGQAPSGVSPDIRGFFRPISPFGFHT